MELEDAADDALWRPVDVVFVVRLAWLRTRAVIEKIYVGASQAQLEGGRRVAGGADRASRGVSRDINNIKAIYRHRCVGAQSWKALGGWVPREGRIERASSSDLIYFYNTYS